LLLLLCRSRHFRQLADLLPSRCARRISESPATLSPLSWSRRRRHMLPSLSFLSLAKPSSTPALLLLCSNRADARTKAAAAARSRRSRRSRRRRPSRGRRRCWSCCCSYSCTLCSVAAVAWRLAAAVGVAVLRFGFRINPLESDPGSGGREGGREGGRSGQVPLLRLSSVLLVGSASW
jgi:hypothetical protein